jgi:ribosome-associated protein
MLLINHHLRIADVELHWSFVRSGGPGGQNVNKVASKAVLRWDLDASPSIPLDLKSRLRARLGRRLTQAGEVVLSSQRFRDQERNRQDCLNKLRELILSAARPPRTRKPTRPSRSSRAARLELKRRRSGVKKNRQAPRGDW